MVVLLVTAKAFLHEIPRNDQVILYKEGVCDQIFAQFNINYVDLVARTATFRVGFRPRGTYNQEKEDTEGKLKVSTQGDVYDISQTAWHKDQIVMIPFQFGNIGYYPSDRYLTTISIKTVWELNGTSVSASMSLAFSGVLPSIRLQSLAPRLVWDDDKVYGIQILAKRTGFTKFFVGFVLFCVWLTALGLPMAVIIAGIRRDRTALGYTLIYGLGFLCLCPILRTLFPGAPPLGSLAVVLGLLWPVVISVLTLALGIHLWWIHNWSPKAPLISVLDGSMDLGKNPYPAAALKDPKHPLLSEFVLPHPAQPVPGLSSSQAILPTLPKDTNKLSPYSKGYQKLGSSRG